MFISKMNKLFHKHGRVAFAILTLLIIVPFILYFSVAPDEILTSFSSLMNKSNVSAYGKRISKNELNKNINTAMVSMILQGVSPDFLNSASGSKQVLMFALDRMVLVQGAAAVGIRIDDKMIAGFLKTSPLFQGENGFTFDRYKMFLHAMNRYGLSEAEVTGAIGENLAIEALRAQIADSIMVTNAGMQEFYNNMNLNLVIRVATFTVKDYLNKVALDDQKARAYFDANKSTYILPKKSKASVIEFCLDDYKGDAEKSITEKAINDYYAAGKSSYSDMKEKEAKAKIKKQLVDEFCDNKAKMNAQNFAVNVFKIIGQGQGSRLTPKDIFKNYAGKNKYRIYDISQWISSVDQNLGQLGKQPALVSSISELFQDQPISNAIKGEKSYFVACLTDRQEARNADFAEVKEKVIQDFKSSQSLIMARAAAADARAAVMKVQKGAKNFTSLMSANGFAGEIKLNVSDYKAISEMKNGEDIISIALKEKQGEVSPVTDIQDGAIMVYVEKIGIPAKDAFEKARIQIESQYKQFLQQLAWANYCLMLKNKANVIVYGESSTSYAN